ncbi:MAG: hypothetical protein ACXVAA_05550 [Candidatus Binataceae bacterium]
MKSFNLWVCSAAIVAAVGLAGNAWCQDATSESSTTVTTVPAEPTVTSKTVDARNAYQSAGSSGESWIVNLD